MNDVTNPAGTPTGTVSPQDPPPDDDPRDRDLRRGDDVQDEATDEVGPYQRLSDDFAAGRLTANEALRRLLLAGAADENGDDVLAAIYADEYDDDGQPHEAR